MTFASEPSLFGEEAPEPPKPSSETSDRRALYLRWRPHRFRDVVGQEHVTRTLRNAVAGGRLSHAYLFTGPRGTGKTSVARILYRAANCEHLDDGDPCNTCGLCTAALAGRALDLVEIDAASNRGIDDIRDLREKVSYRPGEGRYRLYIIDEAHELTTAAWDAFLKTLEEPPPHVLFVLATTEAHKVPPTIVSRCQRFDFRRITFAATREQLSRVAESEGLDVEPAVLDRLARVARGGLRDALSLLDQLASFATARVDMEVARAALGLPPVETVRAAIEALRDRDGARLMGTVVDVAEGKADFRQFVEELVDQLRAVLLIRCGAQAAVTHELDAPEIAWLQEQAPAWPVGSLMALIQELSGALAKTRDAQQFQVQVELALLTACQGPLSSSGQPRSAGDEVSVEPARPRIRPAGASPRATVPGGWDSPANPPSGQAMTNVMERSAPPEALPPVTGQTASSPSAGMPPRPAAGVGDRPIVERIPGPASSSSSNSDAPAVRPESVGEAVQAPPASEAEVTQPVAEVTRADLDTIRQRWPDVLEQLRALRSVLGIALSNSEPLRLEGDTLYVAVTRFERKQVEGAENRAIVEQALDRVFGAPLRLRWADPSDQVTPSLLDDPVIGHAVRMFGGKPRLVEAAGGEAAEHAV